MLLWACLVHFASSAVEYPLSVYPIRLQNTSSDETLPITLPVTLLHSPDSCVKLVESDPNENLDPLCATRESDDPLLGLVYFSLARPSFTFASGRPGHLIIDDRIVATIQYFTPPEVIHTSINSPINVRMFIRPGWSQELLVLQCRDCNFDLIKIAIKNSANCDSRKENRNALLPLYKMTGLYPFDIREDERVTNGSQSYHLWTAVNTSMPSTIRRDLFSTRFTVCLYETEHAKAGESLGDLVFDMDQGDAQSFVFAVMFFLILLPVVCAISWSAMGLKLKRVINRARDVREAIQVRQLESELMRGERASSSVE